MKKLISLLLLGVIIYGCASKAKEEEFISEEMTSIDTVRIAHDSLDYELVFVEQGFDYWMETEALPVEEYEEDFLIWRNLEMIDTYNFRCMDKILYPEFYEEQIIYEPETIDYGKDYHYLLYNYLLFFQERYRQNL